MENSLENAIKFSAKAFLEKSKDKEVQVISHFDTDGISSATIMTKTLKRLDKKFTLKIVKSLEKNSINDLKKDKVTLFLDLASNSLNHIEEAGLKEVFVIDHHEITQKVPESIFIINPELHKKQKISSSSLVYLFCKELCEDIKPLAKLAILGMVGDQLERDIDKLNKEILDYGDIKRKKGLLIYPSTRPLNKTLEYCSEPYIPGVTGSSQGVIELLREVNLTPSNGKYKTILELEKEEMEKLTTSIMLRNPKTKHKQIIGDIFLIKMFGKLEDAREISAIINACSRSGNGEVAIQFLMEIPSSKKRAESIYVKYKQSLISSLEFVERIEKIHGNGFLIINAKDQIKDTMIGTIASILSHSSLYEEGTVITTMAHYEDKIKISVRSVGGNGRNVRELLRGIVERIGGEFGGHENAAGAVISKNHEDKFLDLIKKNLEIEMIRV
jgi:RecJ-like exonuclease